MKKIMLSVLAVTSVASGLLFTATDADAHGRFYVRPRVGVYVGGPLWAPRPYYGYGYPYGYPPVTVVREEPTVYNEQSQAQAAAPAPAAGAPTQAQPQEQQYWYYCQDSKTYYPHVQTCATPWQRVIPYPQQ